MEITSKSSAGFELKLTFPEEIKPKNKSEEELQKLLINQLLISW